MAELSPAETLLAAADHVKELVPSDLAPPIEYWLRNSAALWEADVRRADLMGVSPGGFYVGVLEEQALGLARAVMRTVEEDRK